MTERKEVERPVFHKVKPAADNALLYKSLRPVHRENPVTDRARHRQNKSVSRSAVKDDEDDRVTVAEQFKLGAKDILRRAADDLRKLENEKNSAGSGDPSGALGYDPLSVKLKVTTRDEITYYREQKKKMETKISEAAIKPRDNPMIRLESNLIDQQLSPWTTIKFSDG